MKYLISLLLMTTFSVFGSEVQSNPKDISLAITANEMMVEIQMEAPMHLILGFVKKPQSDSEIKKWDDLQTLWFKEFDKMISIKDLKCVNEESAIEFEIDDENKYGEVLGRIVKKCSANVTEKMVDIKIKEIFPQVNFINLTILPNTKDAQSLVLKNKVESIKL